jgi:SAM-dependent methyltransferase
MPVSLNKIFNRDQCRANLLPYTRKAFSVLPPMNNPRILDLGCGTGVPTIELAQLSDGSILAIDGKREALDALNEKIDSLNLQDRVVTLLSSVHELNFPRETFDIIWMEGSIFLIGFREALEKLLLFLKPKSFLVIHDDLRYHDEKVNLIAKSGFALVDHFIIPGETWWELYFRPIGERIKQLMEEYSEDSELTNLLNIELTAINQISQNVPNYASVFYILRRR